MLGLPPTCLGLKGFVVVDDEKVTQNTSSTITAQR
jgi:hypothetical protein